MVILIVSFLRFFVEGLDPHVACELLLQKYRRKGQSVHLINKKVDVLENEIFVIY